MNKGNEIAMKFSIFSVAMYKYIENIFFYCSDVQIKLMIIVKIKIALFIQIKMPNKNKFSQQFNNIAKNAHFYLQKFTFTYSKTLFLIRWLSMVVFLKVR